MSLRLRVLLIILAVNLAVSGAMGLVLLREQENIHDLRRENFHLKNIEAVMVGLNAGIGAAELTVPRILAWPEWHQHFREVVIVNSDFTAFGPRGIYLNPLGARRRSPDFDLESVEEGLREATRSGQFTLKVGRGNCRVLRSPADSRVIGAVYYEPRLQPIGRRDISGPLLILGIATLVLVAALYLALSRSVVEPLLQLAAGVRRLAAADDATPVQVRGGSKEVESLTRVLNTTMVRVRSFREELEREVALATEEVRRRERQLLLSARLAAMGTLAAGIAHEINNPLGGIMNALRRVKERSALGASDHDYIELIEEGLERIAGIVRRVLEFAPRDLEPTRFGLLAVIARAGAFVEHRARQLGVALVIDGREELQARGDPREIQQVILNLLLNALDALEARIAAEGTGFGPRIEITLAERARPEGPCASIAIRDNGPGMDSAQAERVFDLFFTTKEAGRGTGMGLAISYAIIRNHEGTIAVRTAPGEGFEIQVTLPLSRPEGT